jgi:hypothetical protein
MKRPFSQKCYPLRERPLLYLTFFMAGLVMGLDFERG